MDSENVVIVNQAGEKAEFVTEDKCGLTDDSKEIEEKLGASEDDTVKTVGGAGENVAKAEEKEKKDSEGADEEKDAEDDATDNEAKEDSEEKSSTKVEQSEEDISEVMEKLNISEEVECENGEAAEEDEVDKNEE
ncbi:hypothetical protein WDU94_004965 [Cyamophila willieti]